MMRFRKGDGERSSIFSRRAMLLGGGQAVLLSALAARLYELQVLDSRRFATMAEDNRISLRLLAPSRGLIFDRTGQPLAVNRNNYRAMVSSDRGRGAEILVELLDQVLPETEVVGIDEGQFFDPELPAVCNTLADQGKRVIVAGLDQDYLGKPFEPMPQLLAIAEYITKTLAICMVCGSPANHTQRLVQSKERVLVGASGAYEARCRTCFDPTLAG